ncbi:hypothetical protein D9611_011152 [Ephemerocybe angulata]|uniref:Phosphoglycolate phosphatase n=1 Tax=Ephemerocybe angulata TaxID=980116 RepID=A0A8H5FJP6_9AGAR|nr:hypothetical protein D9611_011152 [Tulosesus angulatus]
MKSMAPPTQLQSTSLPSSPSPNTSKSTRSAADPADNTLAPFSLNPESWKPDPDVAAVACGLDTKVNYTKLSKAFAYAQKEGCHFIATNTDSTYPSSYGLLPGAGSISAPLRYALGKDPVVCGKPGGTMLDVIKAKIHFDPARTIMVGDRLNTDIEFGKHGGLATLLVLTGEHSTSFGISEGQSEPRIVSITAESEITGPSALPTVPDYVVQSLGDLRLADKA